MDISDIDVSFGGDNEPQDEYLTELLGKAYRGDIDCCNAIMPLSFVVPYSDFKPEISDKYRQYFIDQYKDYKPPALYVYEKDGQFIMSDDYAAYYMYQEVESEITDWYQEAIDWWDSWELF